MTICYLAFGANGGSSADILDALESTARDGEAPSVLFTFAYLKNSNGNATLARLGTSRKMLDSGAYSAYNSGKAVDIDKLVEETKKPVWSESVALDVIGNAEDSLKNALYMKEHGSPAMPVFHFGDDWSILAEYKKHFPKIGLSCRFGEPVKESLAWLDDCFARAYPHRFHSFGWMVRDVLMRFPFHSADSTSWELGPLGFGNYSFMRGGGLKLSRAKAKAANALHLKPEARSVMRLQAEVRTRWRNEAVVANG